MTRFKVYHGQRRHAGLLWVVSSFLAVWLVADFLGLAWQKIHWRRLWRRGWSCLAI